MTTLEASMTKLAADLRVEMSNLRVEVVSA